MPRASNATTIRKQAAKTKTKKEARQSARAEGHRRDFGNEIEENHAAASGHADEPIPTAPNSRSAIADEKRAAAKGAGVMSISKKTALAPKISATRDTQLHEPARIDGTKTSRGAKSVDKNLDKGSAKVPAEGPKSARVRRTKSNAEIAEGVTTTARKSPAPAKGRSAGLEDAVGQRGAAGRARVPAPGNRTSLTKGVLVSGEPKSKVERPTSSTGGRKPPKKSARGGTPSTNLRSKGADKGLAD
jgi:hypothetical protein